MADGVESKIGLADLVSSLRDEIDRAWSEGSEENVAFEAGPVEVELAVEVEVVPGDAKLSAKFWVVSAEVGARYSRTNTQRIKFSLTPRDRLNPSKPMLIAGVAIPGETRPEG